LLAACLFVAGAALADDSCVAGPGWHIRVCADPRLTESNGLILSAGSGGDSFSHRIIDIRGNRMPLTPEGKPVQATWVRGQPNDIPYPIELRFAGEVWIGARVTQDRRNGYVCLMYDDHKVKHLDFDSGNTDEPHEKHRDDSDDCKC
jgi:hypothetical protein